jgi:hypothetical protein
MKPQLAVFSLMVIIRIPMSLSSRLTNKTQVRLQYDYVQEKDFPQQLPGPAQPALDGFEPQHVVSPGPGNLSSDAPVREDGVDIIFFRLVLPHSLHSGWSFEKVIRISFSFPQSRQR